MKIKTKIILSTIVFFILLNLVSAQSLEDRVRQVLSALKDRINEVVSLFFCLIWWIIAAFAALLIVWNAVRYISSSEDFETRIIARKRIVQTIVGLIIVLIACPLVNFLIKGTQVSEFKCECIQSNVTTTTTTSTTTITTTTVPQVNCYTLKEFSDGSKEKKITFPDGGGSSSSAKITLTKGVNVCDAKVDVSVISGVNASCYLETQQSCSISGSNFVGVAKLDNEIILALANYGQGRIGMYCDMTTYYLLSSPGCDVIKWLGKRDNPRVFKFGYSFLCGGPPNLPYNSAENLANDYDVVIYCSRNASLDPQTVSILQRFTKDYGKGLMIIGDYYRPGVALGDTEFENLNKLAKFVNSNFNKVSLGWGTAEGYYLEMSKLSIYLDIGSDGVKEYQNPYLSENDKISDISTNPKFTTKLTNLLRECDCPGCAPSGNDCIIDLKFSAESKGEIKLSDLYIYYCLGQCPAKP